MNFVVDVYFIVVVYDLNGVTVVDAEGLVVAAVFIVDILTT